MLTERSKMMREIEDQTEVSLRETERRAEDKRRESAFKDDRNSFLRARGITPVDEDADQIDEDALDVQRKAIARIEVDEAARILVDDVLLERAKQQPRAVMRD